MLVVISRTRISVRKSNGYKCSILWHFLEYYFHVNGSIIGIVQKIDFEIRPNLGCTTPKTSRKVVLDNPSVCLSVCLAVAFPASSHRRKV